MSESSIDLSRAAAGVSMTVWLRDEDPDEAVISFREQLLLNVHTPNSLHAVDELARRMELAETERDALKETMDLVLESKGRDAWDMADREKARAEEATAKLAEVEAALAAAEERLETWRPKISEVEWLHEGIARYGRHLIECQWPALPCSCGYDNYAVVKV